MSSPLGRVLVTGGAGFIGSHLCDALLDRGAQVTCVDNLVGPKGSTKNVDHLLDHPGFELVQADYSEWIVDADLHGFDAIFHQAASKNTVCMEDPELDLRVNGMGALRLLRKAQEHGVRKYVHASTGSVFGELQAKQDEDHPKEPVSFYGVSKLAAESYCRAFGSLFGLDFTVLRYYHVIGPRQDDSDTGGVVPIFVRQALAGEPLTIYGTGEQVRSFTSVSDVVRANLLVAQDPQAARRFFNCASGIRVTINELATFVVEETGSASEIRYADWRPGDIVDFDIDNSRIREIGMAFDPDWRAAVREVVQWKR